MIGSVQIQGYKSIRDLRFDAKRVNVFIGEPNTGKTILHLQSLLTEPPR